MKYIFLTILTTSFFATIATAQNSAPVKAVSFVDLDRYVGKWFEIAKYPNRFQKQCTTNTTAEYTKKVNGRIEVTNTCRKSNGDIMSATGDAKIVDTKSNAVLKVRFAPGFLSFLPFVWGDYWVIDLDQDYKYAVVGTPSRDYLWILSRTPELDSATYQSILKKIADQGFDTNRLVLSPQRK